MLMSRLNKRIVAAVAGIAFLLCQSMAIARACVTMPTPAQTTAAEQPCHGGGGQADSNSQSGGQSTCNFASSAAPELPVFSTAGLPVVIARAYTAAEAVSASLFDPPLLRVEPPPHSILHCCLRN